MVKFAKMEVFNLCFCFMLLLSLDKSLARNYNYIRSNSVLTDEELRRRACLEQPLEAAEEQANVVFTGTVRNLERDWAHPDMMKAEVEIKRIFKGSNVVNQLPDTNGNSLDRWHKRNLSPSRWKESVTRTSATAKPGGLIQGSSWLIKV